jgi:hypothetical protein
VLSFTNLDQNRVTRYHCFGLLLKAATRLKEPEFVE